ncbi:MAG TPA: sulfatase-like hydrolase/transferase [Vicinamibacterales bacterium]|nr:sulfatase-like hydrolase/transferase [Vicinamibacterales bacterium]
MARHPVVRAGLALIAFRAAGLTHRYILQPDVAIGRRLALFVPALATHAGVLTGIVGAFLLACAAAPRWRRAIAIAACATFALLMIAGQADLTVSSITGAPLTPTVFRTFRGLQVVTSNEFLEPLRANWRVTAIGLLAFAAVVFWMMRAVFAADTPPQSPTRVGSALLAVGGLAAAWLVSAAPWAIPPPPIEAAFALEYLGLDRTSLDVPEPAAITHLRSLVGLPPGARWVGDEYPLAYVPAPSGIGPRPRPDIVVVMVESLRAEELGFITGREESVTPSLDALAVHSAVFTSYLSNAFPSAPSVLSFHASAWPHRRKEIVTDFSRTQFDSLPERLRDLGYDTIYVGADPHFDNQDRWLRRWYAGVSDLVASGSEATDRAIVARAMAEIERHDAAATSKPLFAFVSTYSTHYPFRLPADAGEPEAPESAGLGVRYRQVLHYSDRQIGALLRMLALRTRHPQTVTIVVGDHSFYTNLRKTSGLPENDNQWTPLIVNQGNVAAATQRIAEPASHVDVLPTILAIVGDDRPTAAVGTDLFGPSRSAPRSALAIRPGGVRVEREGYSVFVDARTPNGAEIRPSFQERAGSAAVAPPDALQVMEWVNTWSYLVERDRVWNPALLRKSFRGAGQ